METKVKYQQNEDLKTPDYYKSGREDLITEMENGLMKHERTLGFIQGNVFKYLRRYRSKGQKTSDLYKLKDYAEKLRDFEIYFIREDIEDAYKDFSDEVDLLLVFTDEHDDSSITQMYRDCIFNLASTYDVKHGDGTSAKKMNLLKLVLYVDALIDAELTDKDK